MTAEFNIFSLRYNRGQKSLGHCTFKQGNATYLERQTFGRRFYAQGPPPPHLPQPMLKSTGSFWLQDSTLFAWGRGGEGWRVRCFVPLMHFCIGKHQSVPRLLAMIVVRRRGSLVVSAPDSGSRGPGSSPGRNHCVVSLGKYTLLSRCHLHRGIQIVTSKLLGSNLTKYWGATCDGWD